MKSFSHLFLALIFLSTFASAQTAKITRDQYFSHFHEAMDKTDATFPRKVFKVREEFNNGKSEEVKTEFFNYKSADQNRHVIGIDVNGKSTTYRYIQNGKTYFCKEGDSFWKMSRTPCEPPVMLSTGPPVTVPPVETEEFTGDTAMSNGQSERIFRMYQTWTYNGSAFEREQIFTVDSRGKLVKIEVNVNKFKPKESVSTQVETYEYDIPSPVITAPIK